jgi:hypothetical protein
LTESPTLGERNRLLSTFIESCGNIAMIGTWRMVEFADLDKDGKWQCRFGEPPRGYFVYDVTGHVHIQIMKIPALPPFPEAKLADGKPPSPEHALAAYTAYVAYFGTYTVDPEKRVVTHRVEGSLAPDFTDTHQQRPFELEGDRMEIGMARLGGVCWNVCADFADSNVIERRDTAIAMVDETITTAPSG